MNLMSKKILSASLVALMCAGRVSYAQDAAADGDPQEIDSALKEEIAYAEALTEFGFPDFAAEVIADTKKKWPESEAIFFALEIRGMLLLGQGAEAEKKIAALPDRKSSKYWAARLEVANDHYSRGRNEECLKIYAEFFKNNAKPAKELLETVRNAHWVRSQLLIGMKKYSEAAKDLESIMKIVEKGKDRGDDEAVNLWCAAASDAADLHLRVASELDPKKRGSELDAAKKIISKLLWMRHKLVYFGRAIAMKAHLELLAGRVDKAQSVIDDYMADLSDIHAQLEKADPDGRDGLLKISPMPQCRYLLSDLLWKEAKKEASKPNFDKARIGDLIFGAKGKNGKRSGAGAYNHALNVFIRYPYSPWATAAEKTVDEIKAFMLEKFNKPITDQVTEEHRAQVRRMRFRNADEKFGIADFDGAIEDYFSILADYPESKESVDAVFKIVEGYYEMLKRTTDVAKKEDLRLKADAVSGYLAERFAGNPDEAIMTAGGNAVLTLAAKEKTMNEIARADQLYMAFIMNYTRHLNAPTLTAQLMGTAYQEGKFHEALRLAPVMDEYYTNSNFYAMSLSIASICCEKIGDRDNAISYLKRYIALEKKPLEQMQAAMRLASIYQKDGLGLLETATTNATPEEVAAQERKAVISIIQGIKNFRPFIGKIEEKLNDPAVVAADKERYQSLHESAFLYMGGCWARLIEPSKRLDVFKKAKIDPVANSVAAFEEYVAKYPTGKRAKDVYLHLSTIYTTQDNLVKSKEALERLRKEFPDSNEAKTALPRLARSLIEHANTVADEASKAKIYKEGSNIYAEMIRSDSVDYQPIDYVYAGESLIDARDWMLADAAFDKAIAKAGTNSYTTVARARIGKAKSRYAKKDYIGAREHLDTFMEDKKLSAMQIATNACTMIVEIAMIQGKLENDSTLRESHYAAAGKAVKKLGSYWENEAVWKKDTVDLMSADVRLAKADTEDAKGLRDEANSTRRKVAIDLENFVKTRVPDENKSIDKFIAEELLNLEEAYARLVPTLLKLGPKFAGRAMIYAEQYLNFYPAGAKRDLMQRCIKEAEALGAVKVAEEAPKVEEEAGEDTKSDAPSQDE
ncbi:MAG: hypothetical protein J6S30_04915 [Kiritimatiellae bacterium]|nr:hypothetical protein [Kiritimatiellia bacterium]